MRIREAKSVYKTQWFDLVAKQVDGDQEGEPFYSLQMADYVSVIALTDDERIVLVKQYRPAVEEFTLELPSGHVDPGERPELAAMRELKEETGFQGDAAELLGSYWSDTGRSSNRLWVYFAQNVRRVTQDHTAEPGIETILCDMKEFKKMILESKFNHALNFPAIAQALMLGKMKL